MRRSLSLALVLAVAIGTAGCGAEELQFADWTLPVEDGVPTFEYAPVPLDARQDARIEVEEDLVLGADPANPEQTFYRVNSVVPDADGNIYVLDAGEHHIQVFDPSGAYLRTLGREGQGPGEFESPSSLSMIGDGLMLRAASRRLSHWNLDGTHLRDTQTTISLTSLMGIDGGFVARYSTSEGDAERPEEQLRRTNFASFQPDGTQTELYVELDDPPLQRVDMSGGSWIMTSGGFPLGTWAPRVVASRDGSLYLTTSQEYQLHAFGPRRWSLRVAWERQQVSRTDRDNAVSRFTGSLADLDPSTLEWPEQFMAIDSIEVDGHGHVYVFPFFAPLDAPIPPDTERPEVDRPVDIYSADGEHLFSGVMSVWSWTGQLGDWVYATRVNDVTDETEVVRYRLIEPFE